MISNTGDYPQGIILISRRYSCIKERIAADIDKQFPDVERLPGTTEVIQYVFNGKIMLSYPKSDFGVDCYWKVTTPFNHQSLS